MDLNMMMRDAARNGLQTALDAAVTNGDAEAARKIAKDLEDLAVSTAPKKPAFGSNDIKAVLDTKTSWFGTDPKRTAKAMEFGKDMNFSKFASAEAFADAVIKAVDEEFKPLVAAGAGEGDPDDEDPEDDKEPKAGAGEKKPRRSDGPGEGEATQHTRARTTSGPWVKISDAPADVQKEIKRQADKFVSPNAPKGSRETFVAKALESHYAVHQRAKAGKK